MTERLTVTRRFSKGRMRKELRARRDARGRRGLDCVRLVSEGYSTVETAHLLACSRTTVRNYVLAFNEHGFAGLEDGRAENGRQRLLSPEQDRVIIKALEGRAPDGGLWNGRKLRDFIKEEFGIEAGARFGWGTLVRLGWSPLEPSVLDPGPFVRASAHGCGLTSEGLVICPEQPELQPDEPWIDIASASGGGATICGLRSDGRALECRSFAAEREECTQTTRLVGEVPPDPGFCPCAEGFICDGFWCFPADGDPQCIPDLISGEDQSVEALNGSRCTVNGTTGQCRHGICVEEALVEHCEIVPASSDASVAEGDFARVESGQRVCAIRTDGSTNCPVNASGAVERVNVIELMGLKLVTGIHDIEPSLTLLRESQERHRLAALVDAFEALNDGAERTAEIVTHMRWRLGLDAGGAAPSRPPGPAVSSPPRVAVARPDASPPPQAEATTGNWRSLGALDDMFK